MTSERICKDRVEKDGGGYKLRRVKKRIGTGFKGSEKIILWAGR